MNPNQLIKELRQLGIKEDDIILVHSSYNKLRGSGEIEGGPAGIIDALKETVNKGTLLLPALSYENVSVSNRFFNVKETPTCIGVLPETMRMSKDVVRSAHPTHSVSAWGKDAVSMTENHWKDHTPVGPHSPFSEVYRRNGKIVMLGAPIVKNTSLHGVEEKVLPEYLFSQNYDYEVTLENQEKITMNVLRHDFITHVQRYDRVIDILAPEDYNYGKVLNGECYVMEAKAVWEKALVKYQEDINYFVDYDPDKYKNR